MEYRIVMDKDSVELTKTIQWYLDHGWKLQGGVAMAFRPDQDLDGEDISFVLYAQAVVRDKKGG